MIVNEREAIALARLLKISRAKSEEASLIVTGLERAREKALAALKLLDDAVSSEEASARAAEIVGFVHLAGFLAGSHVKRAVLTQTLAKIDAELPAARQDVEAMFAETKKLEHLVDMARTAAEKRDRRRAAGLMDESAIARHVRANRR
jgi:flagellar export protein FliJ